MSKNGNGSIIVPRLQAPEPALSLFIDENGGVSMIVKQGIQKRLLEKALARALDEYINAPDPNDGIVLAKVPG